MTDRDCRDGQVLAARIGPAACLTFLVLALVWLFVDWIATSLGAIQYPYGLDYGEGIVWQQALMILRGDGYSDITEPPFVVFHYTPVFHVVSGVVGGLAGSSFLAAGRAVSVLSTLGAGIVIGLLLFQALRFRESRSTSLICGLIGGLIVLSFSPVAYWSNVMRVDMLAVLFGFLGIYFALKAPERPSLVLVGALFFAFAIYTKQTAIAAPLAALIVLLIIQPRLAGAAIVTAAVLGLSILIGLELVTSGGFLKHTVLHNINRFEGRRLYIVLTHFVEHLLYVFIVIVFLVHTAAAIRIPSLREQLASDPLERLRVFVLLYVMLSTVLLALVMKSGSSPNYFIEWAFAVSLMIGLVLRDPIRCALAAFGPAADSASAERRNSVSTRLNGWILSAIFLCLTAQVMLVPRPIHGDLRGDPPHMAEMKTLIQMIREAPAPVISDDMVALLHAGQEVVWESAIFGELAAVGQWDQSPFVEMIQIHQFGFFVTEYDESHFIFQSRYDGALLEALHAAYPRKQTLGRYTLHLPAD